MIEYLKIPTSFFTGPQVLIRDHFISDYYCLGILKLLSDDIVFEDVHCNIIDVIDDKSKYHPCIGYRYLKHFLDILRSNQIISHLNIARRKKYTIINFFLRKKIYNCKLI